MKQRFLFLLGTAFLLLALVACGAQEPTATPAPAVEQPAATAAPPTEAPPTEAPATEAMGVTVAMRTKDELGTYLVDGDGMSLYLFMADTQGAESSACGPDCSGPWPPLTTEAEPAAGEGVDASLLGTFTREDGSTQVSYNGWPLYYFAPDAQPGDTKGHEVDGFGAEWYVVTPAGEPLEAGEEAEAEATPTEEAAMAENAVSVSDQSLGAGDTVTIDSVTSTTDGWIVIHADADGSPGPVIGHAAVSAGENSDVVVDIDAASATDTLYAMLHVDAGAAGEYEFPGDDGPATDAAGDVVTPAFQVELSSVNAVSVKDQPLGAEDTVTVAAVRSAGPGWIVIHADDGGSPGMVIGHAAVASGLNRDVVVNVDAANATDTLYAMLHVDAGTTGEYEFPGDDVPATDAGNSGDYSLSGNDDSAGGNIITPAFDLLAPTVLVGNNDELGDFLVAANGMTLYLFENDDTNRSNCYDQCADAWPPLTVDDGQEPVAGAGLSGNLGTTTRDDGSIQVTYSGKPLYFYAADQEPGDVNGQGVGDVWFVVAP